MNELRLQNLDHQATRLWRELELWKNESVSMVEEYKLSEKQRKFLTYAYDNFVNMYSKICVIYKGEGSSGFSEKVKNVLEGYFERRRMNFMLGSSKAETAGFFRGLVSLYLLVKNVKQKEEEVNSKKAFEEIKSVVEFFGNIDHLDDVFLEFLLRFAIRFQNALETLSDSQEGLLKLASFISNAALHHVMANRLVSLNPGAGAQQKVSFLMKHIVEMGKPGADDEFFKFFQKSVLERDCKVKQSLPEKILRKLTRREVEQKWRISGLLFRSPLEVGAERYFYFNKRKEPVIKYPAQLCTEAERESTYFRQKLG